MLPETDRQPSQPDYKKIDKFFHNIDFVVPDYQKSSQYMVALHQAFYHWLEPQVAGKLVLDAGCGEGFGVKIIGNNARSAVGIDLKKDLISHAEQRYGSKNVHFIVMDCEKLAFQKGSFDMIVCDETIEHLSNYKAFLTGAFNLLKTGGLFICATTNAEFSFKKSDGSPMNRNHFQEFTVRQLKVELSPYSDEIDIYSEIMNNKSSSYFLNKPARGIEWFLVRLGIKHKIPIGWRNFVREKITGVKVNDMISEGFKIVDGSASGSVYIIAKCKKR